MFLNFYLKNIKKRFYIYDMMVVKQSTMCITRPSTEFDDIAIVLIAGDG